MKQAIRFGTVSSDLLHVIAEQRPDLFIIARNDRGLKLFTEALERIVGMGVESVIAEPASVHLEAHLKYEHHRCNHFSGEDEILEALTCCSFVPAVNGWQCLKALHNALENGKPLLATEAALDVLRTLKDERTTREPSDYYAKLSCCTKSLMKDRTPLTPSSARVFFLSQSDSLEYACLDYWLILGYENCQATVVFARNCPNNTLPIIWDRATQWRPLFRRH